MTDAQPADPASLARALNSLPPDPHLALIFPGQGAQKVGMGRDLATLSPAAAGVFQTANDCLQTDLERLCFEGPADELTSTANAQPAILATSIACLVAALEGGAVSRRPAFLAGHSLGEFTALVAAGSLSLEDALLLVRERGRLMEAAGTEQPGTMAAIVGLDEQAVAGICAESGAEACNYNGPTQIVIGGAAEAVSRACTLARERGGRGLPLNVSGAFHTSLMVSAATKFAAVVDNATLNNPTIPVISNVTARPLRSAAEARTDLKEQIARPVLWQQSLTTMIQAGVAQFIEIGPGKGLTAQLKRSAPDVAAIAIDGAEALASTSNV
jgi:[acyl-carrier-protein] S-malonyltransferase